MILRAAKQDSLVEAGNGSSADGSIVCCACDTSYIVFVDVGQRVILPGQEPKPNTDNYYHLLQKAVDTGHGLGHQEKVLVCDGQIVSVPQRTQDSN